MTSVTSRKRLVSAYVSHRTGITRVLYTALLTSFGIRLYRNLAVAAPDDDSESGSKSKIRSGNSQKVAIDVHFLKRLCGLLKIAFPKVVSVDTALVVAQAAFLVLRTYLSLYVARLDGKITALLVKGEGRQFLKAVGWWMVIGLPASVVNSGIQFLQKTISLRVRARLTDYALNRYLAADQQQPVFYRIQMDTNGVNVGQLMAADTARFAAALPRLYANLAKPLLDVVVYTHQLSQSIGADNVFFLGLAIQLSARFLRLTAPPFGEFVATEAKLEGDFRQGHSRLIEYAEEVALYSGDKPERQRLDETFYSLAKHVDRVLKHRLAYSSLEDFVIKYWWGAAGLLVCSIPVFSGRSNPATRAQNYVVNRKLLVLSSDAVGRLMTSYKEISSLAGITARVSDFIEDIDQMSREAPKLIQSSVSEIDENDQYTSEKKELPEKEKGTVESEDTVIVCSDAVIGPESHSGGGSVTVGDYVEFENVPIVSPAGETLVKNLTFRVDPGHHLLIIGPNGSGKSSLFRILGGLWPLQSGKVIRPAQNDIFYIPQRPYLSHGSLRQQIIYPELEKDTTATDEQLLDILKTLGLESLVENEEGLDVQREWRDDLSMGAQQKIAAARLFYHKPKFAILDECTASVTLDTETTIYTRAKELGISLLTVSHRASLWQYHDKILQFDGTGGYLFADLNPSERLALEEEKLKIDYQLRQVDHMTSRLAALEQERARRESRSNSRVTSRVNSRATSRTASPRMSPRSMSPRLPEN